MKGSARANVRGCARGGAVAGEASRVHALAEAKEECHSHTFVAGKEIAVKGSTHACLLAILLLAPATAAAQAQQSAPPAERAPAGTKITKEQATKLRLNTSPAKSPT